MRPSVAVPDIRSSCRHRRNILASDGAGKSLSNSFNLHLCKIRTRVPICFWCTTPLDNAFSTVYCVSISRFKARFECFFIVVGSNDVIWSRTDDRSIDRSIDFLEISFSRRGMNIGWILSRGKFVLSCLNFSFSFKEKFLKSFFFSDISWRNDIMVKGNFLKILKNR